MVEPLLERKAAELPEAEPEAAGGEPTESRFYISAIRIPEEPSLGAPPMRLHFFCAPGPMAPNGPQIEIVQIAAVGPSTLTLSARQFMRAWRGLGFGGRLVYSGVVTPERISASCEESLDHFIQRRADLGARFRNLQDRRRFLIWPAVSDFRLRICEMCLIPPDPARLCPSCGRRVWSKR